MHLEDNTYKQNIEPIIMKRKRKMGIQRDNYNGKSWVQFE
jgi:hypothetical protein